MPSIMVGPVLDSETPKPKASLPIPPISHTSEESPTPVIDLVQDFVEKRIQLIDTKGNLYSCTIVHGIIEEGDLIEEGNVTSKTLSYFCNACESHYESEQAVMQHIFSHLKIPQAYMAQITKELARQ
jgi:hypothetical protein